MIGAYTYKALAMSFSSSGAIALRSESSTSFCSQRANPLTVWLHMVFFCQDFVGEIAYVSHYRFRCGFKTNDFCRLGRFGFEVILFFSTESCTHTFITAGQCGVATLRREGPLSFAIRCARIQPFHEFAKGVCNQLDVILSLRAFTLTGI